MTSAYRPLLMALWATILLSVTTTADAAVRYAAPGGSGQPPCPLASPCSLYTAASNEMPSDERAQKGDEVVVLPGEYSGTDLGPEERFQLGVGVDLHGAAGWPRPLIRSHSEQTVLWVNGDSTVSDLKIEAPDSWSPLGVGMSTVERVEVTTFREWGIACWLGFRAILRDSFCISHGQKGAGAGQRVGTNSYPEHFRKLRNVTAIGTGAESHGLLFDVSGGEIFVDVKSTIAQGTAADVEAVGSEPGGGPTITLESSAYATAKAVSKDSGVASVTEPGTNGNITAPPILSLDRVHQLPGSPTIDAGVVDSDSGLLDFDGGARIVDGTADIGADEMLEPTAMTIACLPANLVFAQQANCDATVESAGATAATGIVHLSIPQSSIELGTCTLIPSGSQRSSCQIGFAAMLVGQGLEVRATYPGDGSHEPGEATARLNVEAQRVGSGRVFPLPDTILRRRPPHRTASRVATFAFAADEPDARFECRRDRREFRPCQSPFRIRVSVGRHVFRVRATASGQTDPTAAVARWRVVKRASRR